MATETMPTLEQVHAFLRRWYKPERFEGRDNETWGQDYSHIVAAGRLEALKRDGASLIGPHESITGEVIHFDARDVFNPEVRR